MLSAEVSMAPETYVPVADKAVASAVMKFVQELDDHDDVQNVYTNMDVDEDVLKELSQE
jgi:transcriptional/translational regulatory protein YebC/TACO1